jgi:hypothetical protein
MTRITRRRWFGPLVGLVTFLVVLVVGGGLTIVVDSAVRAAEMDVLLSEVEASELEMTVVQTEVQRISEEFGQLPAPTDADRDQLVKDLAATAATGQQAIGEAGDAVGQLEFLPWHAALQRAQEDYLAHNLAWQEYLGRATEDPLELTAPQDLVDSTFADSEVSMREAVPPVFGRALADRVDVIYAEPEDASGGEGQAA